MEIYKRRTLLKPNAFQKILGKIPSENAIIEINNILAKNQKSIEDISINQILKISKRYKLNLNKKFKKKRLELFRTYLHFCLIDDELEDTELKSLKHLSEILLLNEKDTENEIKLETEKLYEKYVKDAVSDGRLDNFEIENLKRIKKNLLIPDSVAEKIYVENAEEILKNFIDGVISDKRISPEEEKEMNEIAKSLGIDASIDEKSKAIFDRYKLFWQIENAELPKLTPDINIQKSENLYFKTSIKWLEQRRITKRVNYGGPTLRLKIAKGVYYRAGSIKAQSVSDDVWQTIDIGQMYLTNKRIIFMGSKGNKNIKLNKILDFTPFKNGVDIQKDTGKSPFFEFSGNIDIFSMILARLIDEL